MTGDHHLQPRGSRVDVQILEVVQDVHADSAKSQREPLRHRAGPRSSVIVAAHRVHRRHRAQRLEHLRSADVAGVNDRLHARQCVKRLGRSRPWVSEIKPTFIEAAGRIRLSCSAFRSVIAVRAMTPQVRPRDYLLSLPERVVRSIVGLGAGLLREVGEVALPRGLRRSHLYRNLVDVTLRYLIEQVGGVHGVYAAAQPQADDFLARRGAGHAIELLGIVAFRVSPVWVLAALADLSGLGRRLIPEIAAALVAEGLLDEGSRFETVDQLLDGLEKTSSRLAETFNTPPLDVASLREEWAALRREAGRLAPARLASPLVISDRWEEIKQESARESRSIFETSSVLAIAALRTWPQRARRWSASFRIGAKRTGRILSGVILDDYGRTLTELRQVGYASYAKRQLSPYVRACLEQFSPRRPTLTQRALAHARRAK